MATTRYVSFAKSRNIGKLIQSWETTSRIVASNSVKIPRQSSNKKPFEVELTSWKGSACRNMDFIKAPIKLSNSNLAI